MEGERQAASKSSQPLEEREKNARLPWWHGESGWGAWKLESTSNEKKVPGWGSLVNPFFNSQDGGLDIDFSKLLLRGWVLLMEDSTLQGKMCLT